MSPITYKCPNCDAGLFFDPKSQQLVCEYCGTHYDQAQLSKPSKPARSFNNQSLSEGTPALYSCPSCGAEVTADSSAAALNCYYCKNSIVLAGQLEGKYQPDKVVPFTIDRQKAIDGFIDWAQKKKFIPKDFYSESQLESITGVYFPYWLVNGTASVRLDATGEQVKRYQRGDYEVIETDHYLLKRGGTFTFNKIPRRAMDKEEGMQIDAIHPFNLKTLTDFSPTYLSGYQAVKRNIEHDIYEEGLLKEVDTQSKALLKNEIDGFTSVSVKNIHTRNSVLNWEYVFLPVWTLAYRSENGDLYHYMMNGQTGKISGDLPLDKRRLNITFAIVAGITFLLLLVGVIGGDLL